MVKSLITFLLSLALVSPVAAQVSGSADAQVGVGVSGSAGGVNVGGQAQVQTDVKTPRDRVIG